PANVSDIWIVDNGTDKVYQYTAAAGRTSGSQNAAATFALAAGNTNPQDIADPPGPDTLLAPVPLAPEPPPTGRAGRPSGWLGDLPVSLTPDGVLTLALDRPTPGPTASGANKPAADDELDWVSLFAGTA